jgi:predicted dinucleotide-binding enzyme
MCGNDNGAKEAVRQLLVSFGWRDVLDLGDITSARATESYLPLWLALWRRLGTATFNIRVVR